MGENVKPDPILAAAIICTAHPQSTDATLPMFPMVLESVEHFCKQSEDEKKTDAQPTIQDKKHRHFGDENI